MTEHMAFGTEPTKMLSVESLSVLGKRYDDLLEAARSQASVGHVRGLLIDPLRMTCEAVDVPLGQADFDDPEYVEVWYDLRRVEAMLSDGDPNVRFSVRNRDLKDLKGAPAGSVKHVKLYLALQEYDGPRPKLAGFNVLGSKTFIGRALVVQAVEADHPTGKELRALVPLDDEQLAAVANGVQYLDATRAEEMQYREHEAGIAMLRTAGVRVVDLSPRGTS